MSKYPSLMPLNVACQDMEKRIEILEARVAQLDRYIEEYCNKSCVPEYLKPPYTITCQTTPKDNK